jgi:hypothetical protein
MCASKHSGPKNILAHREHFFPSPNPFIRLISFHFPLFPFNSHLVFMFCVSIFPSSSFRMKGPSNCVWKGHHIWHWHAQSTPPPPSHSTPKCEKKGHFEGHGMALSILVVVVNGWAIGNEWKRKKSRKTKEWLELE